MAGAFLADTLREQARAELQGKMLQDQIASQVARQIIGQISQQEIGRSMHGMQGRGRALQSAADQTSRREVGMTQLEMQKDQARQEKQLGLITAAASATGALGAHFAMQQEPELPDAPTDADVRATHAPIGQQEVSPGMTVQDILEKQKTYAGEYEQDMAEREELLKNVSGGAKTDALAYGGVPSEGGPIVAAPGIRGSSIYDPYAELDEDEFQQSIANF